MKKLFLPLLLLFFLSCTVNQKKTESEQPVKNVFLLHDSIKCEIYHSAPLYARIVTDVPTEKNDLQTIADSLNVQQDVIYFHIPELVEAGEEYGSISGGYTVVFDDFNKKKLTQEKEIRQNEKAEQIKKHGTRDEDFARKAFVISQDFVKQQLKSPKSADFPFSDYKFSNRVDNTITIESYVDARNAFNAEIRNDYSIKLKFLGGDWSNVNNWSVLDIQFY